MDRILSLDLGTKRIGVAISDSLGMLAHPYDTWEWKGIKSLIEKINITIEKEQVKKMVIGVPWTLKGTASAKTEEVLEIINILRDSLTVPVFDMDERLTSKMAQDSLKKMGKKPSRNKAKIDQLSAVIILQSYLDQH
jgi:putative Holliday junction resolvase